MLFASVNFILLLYTTTARASCADGQASSTALARRDVIGDFDWASITPSETLKWVKCFGSNECARLSVPLNYSNPDNGEKAAIAMFKIPATANSTAYKGPVLFNPGGPGGSGVSWIQSVGTSFATILGPGFDIIGFDPRGTGFTTPRVSFFTSKAELAWWGATQNVLANSTSDAFGRLVAQAGLLAGLSEKRAGDVGRVVSTPIAARDMLEIVRAHGREKLSYYGVSYGSVLGAMFATLYPDNVERMVIDGVQDAYNYTATRWESNALDTDKGLDFFYTACSMAGNTSACPLYAPNPSDIAARVDTILENIKARPLASIGNLTSFPINYRTLDYALVKNSLIIALWSPFEVMAPITEYLAELEKGNPEPYLQYSTSSPFTCDGTCSTSPSEDEFNYPGDPSGSFAIWCGDGEAVPNDYDALEADFERAANWTQFADVWVPFRVSCAGWKVPSDVQYLGPFLANTSFPLLIIGNTIDSGTAISGARKMQQGFSGSVLLTQNSPGHTSTSSTSLCTHTAIRKYFHTGELPAPNTVCEIEDTIFGVKASDVMARIQGGANATTAVVANVATRGFEDEDVSEDELREAAKVIRNAQQWLKFGWRN